MNNNWIRLKWSQNLSECFWFCQILLPSIKNFYFRAFGDGYCKDVTVGGCFFKGDNVIQTVSLSISAELCQDLCYQSTNCAVFQHSAENCTLLREDYRQNCHNAGGPSVNKF